MKTITKASVVCLVLAVGALAGEDVLHLTASDFQERVGDGKVWFLKFYAPWCGHCKRLAPTWQELAQEYKSSDAITVASVDCTKHRSVCDAAEIKGFPTLKIYHGGQSKKQYTGKRTLDDLKEFVEEQKHLFTEQTTE